MSHHPAESEIGRSLRYMVLPRRITTLFLTICLLFSLLPLWEPSVGAAETPQAFVLSQDELPHAGSQSFIAPIDPLPRGITPIHIKTAAELAVIGGEESQGKYFVLDNDIYLEEEWVAIDDFRGTFDGRGYGVYNLFTTGRGKVSPSALWPGAVDTEEEIPNYAGLFGDIGLYGEGNSFRNVVAEVTIKNISVHIGEAGLTGLYSAGGLIAGIYGFEHTVNIENCYVNGEIFAYAMSSAGIVGYATAKSLSLKNCYFEGRTGARITAEQQASFAQDSMIAGGLIGTSESSALFIEDCFVAADILAWQRSGGLIGRGVAETELRVTNCRVEGSVRGLRDEGAISFGVPWGPESFDLAIGGLFGSLDCGRDIVALIDNCQVSAGISSLSSKISGADWAATSYAAGLIGYTGETIRVDSHNPDSSFVIRNCNQTSGVTADSALHAVAGGLIGGHDNYAVDLVMEHCYATGKVAATATLDADAGGLLAIYAAGDFVKGYISVIFARESYEGEDPVEATSFRTVTSNGTSITISDCYASGDITASSRNRAANAGGLVGHGWTSRFSQLTITDSFTSGNVTATSSATPTNNKVGERSLFGLYENYYQRESSLHDFQTVNAGGIVAYAPSLKHSITLQNCSASGDISASSGIQELWSYGGGIIGSVLAAEPFGFYEDAPHLTMTDCSFSGMIYLTAVSELFPTSVAVGYLAPPAKVSGTDLSLPQSAAQETPISDPAQEKGDPIILRIASKIVTQSESTLPEPPVPPQIINGRTMIPFRYLVQTVLGGEVDYNAATQTITAKVAGHTIIMTVDRSQIEIDGELYDYGQAPLVIEGSTLVPLRAFEKVISDLQWDTATQTVTLTP